MDFIKFCTEIYNNDHCHMAPFTVIKSFWQLIDHLLQYVLV